MFTVEVCRMRECAVCCFLGEMYLFSSHSQTPQQGVLCCTNWSQDLFFIHLDLVSSLPRASEKGHLYKILTRMSLSLFSDAASSVSLTFFGWRWKSGADTGPHWETPCDLRAWKHFHLQPNPKQGCALWDWMCHLIPHFVSQYPAVVMLTPV